MKRDHNPFANLGTMLGTGFDTSLTTDGADIPALDLDLVEVVSQERDEFEDEENQLLELGQSMQSSGQWQQIVVRPVDGRAKPYELVAGERRYRAAKVVGMKALRAYAKQMTDEQAADARFAENIQRKNLTQLEEAKRLKHDVDLIGVQATLAKHHKSHAWLSKRLRLLDLPEHTRTLLTNHVSADIELINQVSQIEKADPAAAAKLVGELKATRGKERARTKVATVKQAVKPSNRKPANEREQRTLGSIRSNTEGTLATARDRAPQLPSNVTPIFAADAAADHDGNANEDDQSILVSPPPALAAAYGAIVEQGNTPRAAHQAMSKNEREACGAWLQTFYDAGVKTTDLALVVITGLRKGQFGTSGPGAFALAALLYGADVDAKFDLLNVLGAVKQDAADA